MTQYDLIIADINDKKNFIDTINRLLKEGWHLQGGVSVTTVNHTPIIAQAIYRDK